MLHAAVCVCERESIKACLCQSAGVVCVACGGVCGASAGADV